MFGGGLEIKTTLDPELQAAAEQAIAGRLAGVGPSASLVAIENKTGEVKAMVGGTDYERTPFNLATNGHRQPGSAFKPFTLIAALADGVEPGDHLRVAEEAARSDLTSGTFRQQLRGPVLRRRVAAHGHRQSDNSVYAELGLKVGHEADRRMAQRMGIRTEVSTNPAMTLGGLEGGRDAARDGLRLLHDRQQGRARVGHARADARRPGGASRG